ncbi:bifunctional diguanylate cyclase/phosphodiesterase [Modicisalibacter luteus]|uniref:EAL domain-containing protein n=1 Tax=Modicisalibacter luteus TaxID=453962 RepID=A0ABV7M388_9GAMM|nr:EAL domain-containing protein [Halomonas lutea]
MQLDAQQAIQDLIAQDAPLEVTLTRICEMVDRLAPGLITTIMLVDPDNATLSLKAASEQLATSYRDAMQGISIGEYSGSCGRAAYYQQPVVTEDILKDPCWENYRALATHHRLRACWSYPVSTREGGLLGTFAGYYPVPGRPSATENDHLGRAACLAGLAVERHQDRQALRVSEQHYRSLFTHHPDAVFSMNLNGIFLTANQAVLRHIGCSEHEVIGLHYSTFVVPEDRPRAERHFAQACAGAPQHYEIQATTHLEPHYYLAVTNLPIEVDGQVVGVYGIVKDITENKANEARLAHHATHDPLTGRANRTLLEERLGHDYELILQHQGILEVLFIDLDDFKPINDSLGHAAGDQLLKAAAGRLQGLLMPADTLARFGGDEFVIVLPSLDMLGRAGWLAEQALASLARPFEIKGRQVYVTASIGIATSQVAFQHPTELVQYADLAMYEAKKKGRNTVCWYNVDVMEVANEQVTLRRELHEAMSRGDFCLHYQPIIQARDGKIVGFEALLRWNHPTLGNIPPSKFIPLAEQTGQIIPLGQWVMARACWDIKQLNNRLATHYFVSVNVSPLQFHRKDFVAQLQIALTKSDLAPTLLDVEVTEGVLVEANDGESQTLKAVRSMGVGVSIDDFGTGYSSLSYLRKLPISKIKLDREFLIDIQSCPRSAAIVDSIIQLAHSLDLEVVAEGVETAQQHRDLLARTCDLCQGYLYGKAMAPHCLEAFILECGDNPLGSLPSR